MTRDGVVNLEEAVLGDAERWVQSVWDTIIGTANGVFPRGKVATGDQAEGRQEDASIVAESEGDLAGVSSLGKSGDSVALDVSMVGHGIKCRAHASDVSRTRCNERMKAIVARDLLQAELLRTKSCQLLRCPILTWVLT